MMSRSLPRRHPWAAAGMASARRDLALRLLPLLLAAAPLVVLPGHVDFARLPQQIFVALAALSLGLVWVAGGLSAGVARRRPLDLPLAAFLAWSAVSLFSAVDRDAGLRTVGLWVACAVVYALVSRTAGPGDVPRLAGGLLLGGGLAAVVGLGQALLGLSLVPQAVAPAATLANRNVAGGYLAALVPLALVRWPSRTARVAAAVAAATILVFLPLTQSRAVAVALALQLAVLAALQWRSARRPRVVAALVAAALVLAAAAWLTLADAGKTRSTSIRWSLAGSALSMARDHPLLGVGIGGFGAAYPSHGPVPTSALGAPLRVLSPHNEVLQVLAESGLPGLLLGLWVVAGALSALRRLRRSPDPPVRRTALALGLGLVGFTADAAFGFPLRGAVSALLLAVLLGVLAALDPDESRAAHVAPGALAGRLVPGALRMTALAGLAALLAITLSSSLSRLQDDRARYRAAFLPVAHAQAGPESAASCGPAVTLERKADGRVDLSARGVTLVEVLRCLVEHAEFRLEYDGPAPRQTVSVDLRGETLAGAVESLLEGLGIDYLLGRDPTGTRIEQLIIFGSSRAAEPSRASTRPSPARPGRPVEPMPAEPPPQDESQPPGMPPAAPPEASMPFTGLPPGAEPSSGVPEPGGEPEPSPVEPEELTPMTLQLGRGSGGRVAMGLSPVR